ncbi:MAG: beta-ketoacyl-ACP reductase [Alphaproteobacteria bacterium]|nr:MAG: beta-ketoacyl-ACP reductase [Alphaproteobacteria bacterium]
MFDLSGKTALVTGASGGIGSQIVTALHGQGAKVILHGTRANRLARLQESLGERAFCLPADLSDREAVTKMMETATKLAGPVDILVNNAGITRDNLFMRMKDEDWDDVLAVNMTSSMLLCRSAIRSMMKARWGRIISIASIVGVTGNPGQTNYAASKAGMIGFSKSLAAEVASRGVTVNVIAPGFIETPMTDVLSDDQKSALLSNVPSGRLGQGSEIAAAVVYLASQEAGYVTGSTLHVNGGMAML